MRANISPRVSGGKMNRMGRATFDTKSSMDSIEVDDVTARASETMPTRSAATSTARTKSPRSRWSNELSTATSTVAPSAHRVARGGGSVLTSSNTHADMIPTDVTGSPIMMVATEMTTSMVTLIHAGVAWSGVRRGRYRPSIEITPGPYARDQT